MSIKECPSFGNQTMEDGQCGVCLDKKRELFKRCHIETIRLMKEPQSEPDNEMPRRFNDEIGRMHVMKGRDHGNTKQILSWETVKPCRGERCGAYDLCEYLSRNIPGSKCKVETIYLKAIASVIYRNFNTVMDEPTMMRVGMHLMPIYQNLCRMKIIEAGVVVAVDEDARGKLGLHPVYKEMRETIKLAEQTWRSLGLTDYYIESNVGNVDVEFSEGGTEVLPAVAPVKEKKKLIKRGG